MNKRIAFIHVAKAAGSSVNNHFLKNHSGNCLTHCEAHLEQLADYINDNNITYLGGHVSYMDLIEKLGEEFFYFSFFRDPKKHLYSHLNWVRELARFYNQTRYDNHPPIIQKIADRLIKYDLTQADELNHYLASTTKFEKGLFDNCQIRYFLKDKPVSTNSSSLEEAVSNLNKLDFVGITDFQHQSITTLSNQLNMPCGEKPIWVNSANEKVLAYGELDEKVISVLEDYTKLDQAFYKEALDIFHRQD